MHAIEILEDGSPSLPLFLCRELVVAHVEIVSQTNLDGAHVLREELWVGAHDIFNKASKLDLVAYTLEVSQQRIRLDV